VDSDAGPDIVIVTGKEQDAKEEEEEPLEPPITVAESEDALAATRE